ncbi:hypothetical protein ERO13_A07G168400v2 [Gossypium hirsutum]|uniref:Lipase n=1 Tax=Gossypium hirsutum TaxID=3635 RepID=A0ABM3C0S1_GOSHI|nr:triacylglycerol lipase 2-like isoform X3 [Gossypium hirsutum]KAG4192588.1 hypothetical protein ERO13_A07G168400v2 [Gossypium hirsutum]
MKLLNTIILTYTILLILSTPNFLSLKAQENGTGTATMPVQSSEGGFCKSMVETNGYECEDHNVTTKDGYILNVVRIPMGGCRDCRTRGNKSPVLLQHGVFVAYWNWSLDELVAYDLPATFQYVYDQTGQKLHFVGHSLGTLMVMAAMSRDQLVNMLESVALLSPVAYMGHTTSLLSRVIADNFIAETLDSLGFYKFDMRNVIIIEILKVICRIPSVDCTTLLFTPFTGQNCCMKPSIMDIFLDHEPQPAAMKIVIHMCQLIRGGNTTMFDYNDSGTNLKHYGQPTPPAYNMIGIPKDLPIFLSHGGADALSDVDDVKLLLDSLQGHDPDKIVVQFIERFAHADYVMSGNAKEHVYDPFIAFLSRLH